MGETDTRVPRCALYDRPAWSDEAFLFGIFDEVESSSVFDRPAGRHELGFGKDGRTRLFGQAVQADLTHQRHSYGWLG